MGDVGGEVLRIFFDPAGYASVALRPTSPRVGVRTLEEGDIDIRFDRDSGAVLGFFFDGVLHRPEGRFVIPARVARLEPGGGVVWEGQQAVLTFTGRDGGFDVEVGPVDEPVGIKELRPGILVARGVGSGRLVKVGVVGFRLQPEGNLLVPYLADTRGPRETAVTTGR